MRDILVKLADKFDQEGKHDLANEVDSLLTTASRPSAPLKNMDDGVKKDLLKFIHDVKSNIGSSVESLNELFRRLRYFDISDSVKDLKLDKALKELGKVQECMDIAEKSMYALSYGKTPSRADMEQLADDFGSDSDSKTNPLEFFNSQNKDKTTEKDLADLNEEDELLGGFVVGPGGVFEEEDMPDYNEEQDALNRQYTDEDVSEDDMSSFWEEDDNTDES